MKCMKCKGEMKETTTTFNSMWGDYTVAISGIKGYKCDECDELVFSVEEARMIQNITAGLADSKSSEKPDLLNVQEVADLLRVSNQTVYNMLKDGRLSATKVGKEWRFSKDAIYEATRVTNSISVAARGEALYDKNREFVQKVMENEE
jgi:excisionase family DNA binding protein/YgiT-type zinc finger domain-containing protein